MKPVKPDSLLPFAIAAILGFLVLGVNGGDRRDTSKSRQPGQSIERISDYEGTASRKSPDLHAQLKSPPRTPKQ